MDLGENSHRGPQVQMWLTWHSGPNTPPGDMPHTPCSTPVGPQTQSAPTCQGCTFAVLFPRPFPPSCVG